MAKVYSVEFHDHDLENIIFPALREIPGSAGTNAIGLIERQKKLIGEIKENGEFEPAPVIDGEQQAAPDAIA